MKTIIVILITFFTVTPSFAGVYNKDVSYDKFYEDSWVYSYYNLDSKTKGSTFSIKVKTYIKSNSTKQTRTNETFVVNCNNKTYHTEESTIYRNNIEISYNEINPERDIEDNIPAKLYNLYCK